MLPPQSGDAREGCGEEGMGRGAWGCPSGVRAWPGWRELAALKPGRLSWLGWVCPAVPPSCCPAVLLSCHPRLWHQAWRKGFPKSERNVLGQFITGDSREMFLAEETVRNHVSLAISMYVTCWMIIYCLLGFFTWNGKVFFTALSKHSCLGREVQHKAPLCRWG